MTNLEKIEEQLKNDPALQEKLAQESKRLAESGKKDVREISAEAVKTVFGLELTEEELDQVTDAAEKLDLDALDNVAGGGIKSGVLTGIGASIVGMGTVGVTGMGLGALFGGLPGACVGAFIGIGVGAAAGIGYGIYTGVTMSDEEYDRRVEEAERKRKEG